MNAREWVRLRSSDNREEYVRAAWAEMPDSEWLAVLEEFPDMRSWVAHAKKCPLAVLQRLATDSDPAVRSMVASRRRAGVELLRRLATDVDEAVRQRVAFNPKTPHDVLGSLQHDPVDLVSNAATRQLATIDDKEPE